MGAIKEREKTDRHLRDGPYKRWAHNWTSGSKTTMSFIIHSRRREGLYRSVRKMASVISEYTERVIAMWGGRLVGVACRTCKCVYSYFASRYALCHGTRHSDKRPLLWQVTT